MTTPRPPERGAAPVGARQEHAGASEAATAAVVVRGLDVVRGSTTALAGIDLEVAAGSVTGLLGPSGSGKTTLMRAIMGVQRVRAGTVTVLGLPAGSPGLRHRVGYVSQSAGVYPDLTVEENLRYFARVLSLPRSGREGRRGRHAAHRSTTVADALETVDLLRRRGQQVGTLSGGELSRVSLAVALLGAPELLVLDEPTVGLDPVLRTQLWATFRAVAAGGTTLLVSSHVMDEAARCDRLLLLRGGHLLAATTPAGLLEATRASSGEEAFLRLIGTGGAT